jgi:hypothetical protein
MEGRRQERRRDRAYRGSPLACARACDCTVRKCPARNVSSARTRSVRGKTRIGSVFSQSVNVLNLYCCELNDRQIHVVVDLRIQKRRQRPKKCTTLGRSRFTGNVNNVHRNK